MKLVTEGVRFRVIDDFLSEDDLKSMSDLVSSLEFECRPSVVDYEGDGEAHRSRGAILWHDDVVEGSANGTADSIPDAYREVFSELAKYPEILGRAGVDWSVVGLTFWQYAAGNRLGWHNDTGTERCGEFILFLHDEWRASWGGELLLLDRDPDSLGEVPEGLSPVEAVEARVSQAEDCLVAIVPKPNRLVIVQEGTIHCIHRVDRTAGEKIRQTMTGFVASSLPDRRATEVRSVERLAILLGSS